MSGVEQPSPTWQEIESFQYPEMPWTEDAFGESLAEVGAVTKSGAFANEASRNENDLRARTIGSNGSINGSVDSIGWSRAGPKPSSNAAEVSNEAEFTGRLVAETRIAEERGRNRGMEMGLIAGREEACKQLESERNRLHDQAVTFAASFTEERDRYLHRWEQETVRLALAIAARILRREAQMDPLLLTGAVRVALGQLSQSTTVRLRVPARDEPLWKEALARMPGLALRPVVIADSGMELGECRMETELGSADLGLWPQLKEIERGFFDRVGSRGTGVDENAAARTDPGNSAIRADAWPNTRPASASEAWSDWEPEQGEALQTSMAASGREILE